MVNKKVNPRYRASEFPRGGVVMVAKIRHNVVEFQDFVPFVLLLQSRVKRDLWHCAVSGSTNCAVGAVWSGYSRGTRGSRRPSLSGRTNRSRWTRLAARTPRTHPPDAPRLPLWTLNKRRKRLDEAVVFDRVACRGRGCGPVRIANHLTGSEHLIASGGPGGVHHDRDQNHQHQHQRDATNTSCNHLHSAGSPCSLECVVFQPACGRQFCRGKNFTSSWLKLQGRETKKPFKWWCAKVNIHNFYAPRFSWFISTFAPREGGGGKKIENKTTPEDSERKQSSLLCSAKFLPTAMPQENMGQKWTVIRPCVRRVRGGVDVMDGTECMREKMKEHTTVMQLWGSETWLCISLNRIQPRLDYFLYRRPKFRPITGLPTALKISSINRPLKDEKPILIWHLVTPRWIPVSNLSFGKIIYRASGRKVALNNDQTRICWRDDRRV